MGKREVEVDATAFSLLPKREDAGGSQDSYTINYNTVSIIEYIKFASKVCNANFIFNAEDLNFTVTVLSDAPITRENVLATLIQMLRIHGFLLLEQGNNLVIHKSPAVRQPATLVFEDGKNPTHAGIVTRVFRLKNSSPDSIAAIIRPMVSDEALLEVSRETRQLILTDVTASVDKVASLIENLDAPHTPLEIRSYEAKYNKPEYLIELTAQIMTPLAQGNPFILVPQALANTVFIVSTPELNSKAISVLSSLDTVPKKEVLAELNKRSDVLLLALADREPNEVLKSLKEIASKLQEGGTPDQGLLATIDGAKWIPESNSLMFIGTPAINAKIREFASALDLGQGATTGKSSFYVYEIQGAPSEEILESLKLFAKNLNKNHTDDALVRSIDNMKYIKETNAILFTGSDTVLKRLQEVVPQFDIGIAKEMSGSSQFLIYKPKVQKGEQLIRAIKDTTDTLKSGGLADPTLLRALGSMKWIKNTNSLIFTGDPSSLARIQTLLADFDSPSETPPARPGYFIYKVENTTGDLIEEDLDSLAKNLQATGLKDSPMVRVIEKLRYVKETNSLLLTGDPQAIDEVKALIIKYDTPRQPPSGPGTFFMYKPVYKNAGEIETSMQDVLASLKSLHLADPGLLETIGSMKYVQSTNALIFSGTPDAIQKTQTLLKEIDNPQSKNAIHVGASTFLLYKLKNLSSTQILSSLKSIATDLKKSGSNDKDFLSALASVKYVKETNSLMFTGREDGLNKVQALVDKLDIPGGEGGACIATATSFFIYRPQAISAADLEKNLLEFVDNLQTSGLNDPCLIHAIHTMKFNVKTQALVFTADQKTLDRVKELLRDFDLSGPVAGGFIGDQGLQSIDNTSFLVYKLQFHKGDEIQNALRQIAKDLANAKLNENLYNAINSIQWLETTNSLLASGEPETLTRLRELIKNLDIPLKQVFIEILVINTSLSNTNTFGLLWGANAKYKNKFSSAVDNSSSPTLGGTNATTTPSFFTNMQTINAKTTPTPSMIPWSQTFELGVIGDIIMHKGESFLSLGSLLNALQTDTETTTVFTPKLIAQDSKTSTLFIGFNTPFSGSFVSNQGATSLTTANLEYRDIGFNLSITPVLGNSDIITLDINIDQSSIATNAQVQQLNFPSGAITGITSNRTTLTTTVHIPDRHFLILSGMVENQNQKQTQGIPCLGGLPIIGAAFSQNNKTDINNNIVIFMRPTILNSLEDMQKVTERSEEFFREQAGTPFLEQGFNDGMETIKFPEDE
jgi:type II secretory pathway component GspD/PulD (secretin)